MKTSIVIPVYNKEKYVRQCLESALAQSFDDYEVIAVDDGSIDDSGNICDMMAQKDSRLHVIHTENRGVTAARLKGVEEARGEYIMFCDSDDKLKPHALHNAINAVTTYNADEVIAPYENHRGVLFDAGRRGFIKPIEVIQDFLALKNNFPPNCAVLFRRDILLDGCLDLPREIYMGEDILFHIRYLSKITKVFCLGQSNYIYNMGLSSYPEVTLDHDKLYDRLLHESLQPIWNDIKDYFTLYQIKRYEYYINKRQFYVLHDYYLPIRKLINKNIPIQDRLAIQLTPHISYMFIHTYKQLLNIIKLIRK